MHGDLAVRGTFSVGGVARFSSQRTTHDSAFLPAQARRTRLALFTPIDVSVQGACIDRTPRGKWVVNPPQQTKSIPLYI